MLLAGHGFLWAVGLCAKRASGKRYPMMAGRQCGSGWIVVGGTRLQAYWPDSRDRCTRSAEESADAADAAGRRYEVRWWASNGVGEKFTRVEKRLDVLTALDIDKAIWTGDVEIVLDHRAFCAQNNTFLVITAS